MKRISVSSSNIASVGYAPVSRVLEIEFLSKGSVYQYYLVPELVYIQLMNASSKGSYFIDHIRDKYNTRKIS
jgi:hypothetical protein